MRFGMCTGFTLLFADWCIFLYPNYMCKSLENALINASSKFKFENVIMKYNFICILIL